jgi:plastocyanin
MGVTSDAPDKNEESSMNPAIDTVPAGTAVTWTWSNTGSTPHSVEFEGTPSFASSQIQSGSGKTYSMTGRIAVQ